MEKETSNIRVTCTSMLLYLIRKGQEHGFNRTLETTEVLKHIDLDGLHVMAIMLPFHEQAWPNIDHHRVQLLMQVEGTSQPLVTCMDISDSDWNQLVTATEYINVLTLLEETSS